VSACKVVTRSAVLVQASYSAYSTVGSKQRPELQGSATVNKGIIANINAGNKRIRKAVPYTMTRVELNYLLEEDYIQESWRPIIGCGRLWKNSRAFYY